MAQKKSSKSASKAKPKSAAKPAHKQATAVRKTARKAPVKHATRTAKSSSSTKGGDFTRYSGKFTVRLPKSLHQALVVRAEREGVSLNLFVTNALSRTVATPGKR